jgi:fatty acid desaturase
MWIGNRQHSLAIQMHDGSHSLISRKRWLNDFVGEVFCAWPLFFRMAAYRENHLLHHTYTNTAKDPDFRPERFPTERGQIIKGLLMDLVGLGAVEQLRELRRLKKNNVPRKIKLARVAFYATAAVLITHFGGWQAFALYWLVPIFTWLRVALRLRAISDHAGVQDLPHPFNTRTVVPSLFDRLFLAPRSSSYHLGHHFYAAVPCYRLKELHGHLMKDPLVAKHARITKGYHRLFAEFPTSQPAASRASRRVFGA